MLPINVFNWLTGCLDNIGSLAAAGDNEDEKSEIEMVHF